MRRIPPNAGGWAHRALCAVSAAACPASMGSDDLGELYAESPDYRLYRAALREGPW